jgi:hypothetical protein
MQEQITTKRQVTSSVIKFKYCVTAPTNESGIYEEDRNHEMVVIILSITVQNISSSNSLYRTIKIKIHKTIILPLVPYV